MNKIYETPASRVYVLADEANRITRCEGEYSLANCTVEIDTGETDQFGRPITTREIAPDWLLIDEGYGDRYNLAQTHYFDGGLHTSDGVPRYKLEPSSESPYGFAAVIRTEDELEADRAARPEPEPTNPSSDSDVWEELDRAYREGVESI